MSSQLCKTLLQAGKIDARLMGKLDTELLRQPNSPISVLLSAKIFTEAEIAQLLCSYLGATISNVPQQHRALDGAPLSTPIERTHPAPALFAQEDSKVPAVRLLQDILLEASTRGASDLHIEPAERDWRLRLRIDGKLHEVMRGLPHLKEPLITRIKVLSNLDIAERRIPQDGRLKLPLANGKVEEYRVSALPTLLGEKLVLRRLDSLSTDLNLPALGFDDKQCATLNTALQAPHGMVLVTGPTGSGKTLSLYCFLQSLNQQSLNLCSVEDPAEIQLAGINQVSVRDKAGLTFATTLRAFLRQDPDVIMVGEIRDAETADVAIKAAQTGHLVLSTLHTNDAPATLARLLDIGIAPFNLAAAIRVITAQRLVRKLCPDCRVPIQLALDTLRAAGCSQALLDNQGQKIYQAKGCAACHGIGYRGRIGIHQVMPISDAMRELIVARSSTHDLAAQAKREGVQSLREAGLAKVWDGTTSLEEVCAVTEAEL